MINRILFSTIFFCCLKNSYPQAGKLDSAFGTNGIVKANLFDYEFYYTGTAIQSDGKIVVAIGGDFSLARYNIDGTIDSTFSEDGKQTTDFGFPYSDISDARSVAIQSDGKIVVAGYTSTGFALARYNTDGAPDTTFSEDGKQTTHFQTFDYYTHGSSLAIQSDGKIVLAGTSLYPNDTIYLVLARYNTDGSLDNKFSDDGKQTTELGVITNFQSSSVAIQSDGKIIVVSSSSNNNFYDKYFLLVRYNTDGSLDTTFSEDGKQTGSGVALSAAIQNDGKILVAGSVLARYNINGSLDSSFLGNSKQPFESGFTNSITTQKDGKIIVAGYILNEDYTEDFAIARFNTDGSADKTFGEEGKQVTKVTSRDRIYDIAISGNKLYAAGSGAHNYIGLIARYFLNDEDQTEAPAITLTSPANNAIYTAPATVLLSADATDEDGTVKTVDFYNGNTLIFTEHAPPYYRKWYNVKEGNYIITAKATDNNGISTTSAPVHITVLPSTSPSVNITSPLNESKFTAPADIFLRADAVVPNGTISKVEFYNGNDLVLTEYKAPYGNKWRNVPPGNYSFTAKITDGNGNVITSQPVAVTVTGALSRSIVKEDKPGLSERPLSLHINPNPVANILNLSVDGLRENNKSTISIISAPGVIVKTIQSKALNNNMKLDVSSLSAGVYIMGIVNGDKVLYKRFVKL